MGFQESYLSAVSAMVAVFFGIIGTYWAVEMGRGTPEAGSNLWACVFMAVLFSIVFWFDQRRQEDTEQSARERL